MTITKQEEDAAIDFAISIYGSEDLIIGVHDLEPVEAVEGGYWVKAYVFVPAEDVGPAMGAVACPDNG